MKRSDFIFSGALFLASFTTGCVALPASQPVRSQAAIAPATAEEPASAKFTNEAQAQSASQVNVSPFAGRSELSVETLVEQVLARNPSLAQMTAAWQAAAARYPQVTSLDDPMFGTTFGPGSFGSNTVDFAYRLEVSQKLPYPGKLGLKGRAAEAEANAAQHDVADTRLQLIESARNAFFDYYLVQRALAVNEESLKLLTEFRQNAQTRYKNAQAPQQDMLQADVELGRQRERELTLTRMKRVAAARINTLLHLPPDAPLPPPGTTRQAEELPEAHVLRDLARTRRPDLHALAERIAADEAALALARREYCPDFEVMAAYDAFWQERPLRSQVGVKLNLPIQRARRHAAVAEAEARLAQRRAELDKRVDQVNFEVQQAYEQVNESEKIVRLYKETILPAALANVKEAQSAYVTGKTPFLSLVEAQRNLVGLRDRHYEAIADYFRRRATLERVAGGPL